MDDYLGMVMLSNFSHYTYDVLSRHLFYYTAVFLVKNIFCKIIGNCKIVNV